MIKKIFSLMAAGAICLLSASAATSGRTVWHAADTLPLLGKAIADDAAKLRYQRLPDSIEHKVKRYALYAIGKHSAGMALRFRSDAPSIKARWHSLYKHELDQMTPTAMRGLDLYMMMPDSTWTFVQTARPDVNSHDSEVTIFQNFKPEMREYMLYLSLYDYSDSIYLGVPDGYMLGAPRIGIPSGENPVVYYGTSLVQGGCVNRAGMSHSNQLRRRLNRDIINLGFGGHGQLDLEVAEVIAGVKDPSLVVLDFIANCSSGQIDTLMIPFVDIIRKAHPEVPILFMECLRHPRLRFDKVMRDSVDRHDAMMRLRYADLTKRYDNLHYLPSTALDLGDDWEHTVDALHLTDMGAQRFADILEPIFRALLAGNPIPAVEQ